MHRYALKTIENSQINNILFLGAETESRLLEYAFTVLAPSTFYCLSGGAVGKLVVAYISSFSGNELAHFKNKP